MLLTEIEKTIHPLSRTEKLQLIQFITAELLKDERLDYFESEKTYTLWSVYDEGRAAQQLTELLEQNPS
jgi:hypothetical protein